MERSITKRVNSLKLKARKMCRGAGFLAITNSQVPPGVGNVGSNISLKQPLQEREFDHERGVHAPSTFKREKKRTKQRAPVAINFVRDSQLNEFFDGENTDLGIIVPGEERLEQRGAEKPAGAIPPGHSEFCTGCPERQKFNALIIVQQEVCDLHIAADIRCHSNCTLPPFNRARPWIINKRQKFRGITQEPTIHSDFATGKTCRKRTANGQ